MTAKTLAQHDELMKKTETMSILMETNKILREEKDKLEQELQQTQTKVSVLFSGKCFYIFTSLHYPRVCCYEKSYVFFFWVHHDTVMLLHTAYDLWETSIYH